MRENTIFPFSSVISAEQFDPLQITQFFSLVSKIEDLVALHGRLDILSDKVIGLLFFEPSSRTMMSFQSAIQKLGAGVVFAQGEANSSFTKGESIEDTIKVTASYVDLIVMRHRSTGSADAAASAIDIPFVNAGDGSNEHPTQALVDAYTISKEIGRLNNLKVTFGFDPLQSRSIHSLAILLSLFDGNEFVFISPDELKPSESFMKELRTNGAKVSWKNVFNDFSTSDVLYLNRLQEERFEDRHVFEENRLKYQLKFDIAESEDFLILDPLPRIDEIDVRVDTLKNAAYFRQAANGIPVRMALLVTLLGCEDKVRKMYIRGEYLLSTLFDKRLPDRVDVYCDPISRVNLVKNQLGIGADMALDISGDANERALNCDYWYMLNSTSEINSFSETAPVSKNLIAMEDTLEVADLLRFLHLATSYEWENINPPVITALNALKSADTNSLDLKLDAMSYGYKTVEQFIKSIQKKVQD